MKPILINGAFVGQRITGQQRYAQEISKRLLGRRGVTMATPTPNTASGRVTSWAWVQGPRVRTSGTTLLSMTVRAPAWRGNHVFVAHDAFPLTHPEWYTRAYVATHAPLLRHHLRHAKGVITVSPSTEEAIQPWLGRATPTVVAPNGITEDLLTPHSDARAQEILGKYDLKPHTYFLTVGSSDPRKNIGRLIKAYSSLPTAAQARSPLVVVGGFNDGVFASTASDTPLGGLRRLDYISDDHLACLYAHAMCFVLPSLDEGFGIPVLEAAAHDIPLLLSDIPVFRWIADKSARFFDPLSVTSIADVLRRTAEEAPHGETGTAFLASLRQRFNWDFSADTIYEFIQSL